MISLRSGGLPDFMKLRCLVLDVWACVPCISYQPFLGHSPVEFDMKYSPLSREGLSSKAKQAKQSKGSKNFCQNAGDFSGITVGSWDFVAVAVDCGHEFQFFFRPNVSDFSGITVGS